jgi:hypothetical protein
MIVRRRLWETTEALLGTIERYCAIDRIGPEGMTTGAWSGAVERRPA